jgi:hypothetical protein
MKLTVYFPCKFRYYIYNDIQKAHSLTVPGDTKYKTLPVEISQEVFLDIGKTYTTMDPRP